MDELEIIQYKRVQGLHIFFDCVDYRTPHFHPEWELIWIVEGSLSVTCGSDTFVAGRDALLLFSPNQAHEFHREERECLFLCLQVSPELLNAERWRTMDSVFVLDYCAEPQELRRMMRRILEAYTAREPFFELYCIGQVTLLFHLLFQSMPSHIMSADELARRDLRNQRLAALIRFVDENYMHKIRLADFAEQEGCSLSYMSHFVKDALHQSFQDYVTSVRVNCACKLIASGRTRLLDVCMESGFSDYRYFSNAFRRQFNMTPEQYKLSYKKPESTMISHGLHSLERFYSDGETEKILKSLSV